MKLDENERGKITRLMKVKDMMLAQKLADGELYEDYTEEDRTEE